jgi:hypothetical protein
MSKPTIPPNPPTTINPQALQNPDAIYEAFCSLIRSCQLKYVPCLSAATADIRTDCPILIWMLSLNREYTRQVKRIGPLSSNSAADMPDSNQEYEDCWQLVHDCIPHITIEKQPENADSFSTYTYASALVLCTLLDVTHDSYQGR